MRIAILSRAPRCYSTRRLREAFRTRGHDVKIRDPLKFSVSVERGSPELFYQTKLCPNYDAVVPRIGSSITFYGTAVVRQFEQMGVFTLNTSHAITVSRDKLRSLQVMSRHNIGVPATCFVSDRENILPAIEELGGEPVIIKLLEGTQGVGVILAETKRVAKAIVEAFQSTRQNVLIQKFVAESRGCDLRALVVGGKVVAAIRRRAAKGEFRSNLHRGGSAQAVELEPEYEHTAIHAAQILGLRVAGVDMLESDDGPQLMEVNSSPGLEGIEGATDVDVAGAIAQHVEDQLVFPEVDLQQRLSLGKGYGVAEFHVQKGSELAGKTLREASLSVHDVLVLSIERRGLTIPNPGGDTQLRAGDHLLCYGKLLTLKSLIPLDRAGRRKKKPGPRRRTGGNAVRKRTVGATAGKKTPGGKRGGR